MKVKLFKSISIIICISLLLGGSTAYAEIIGVGAPNTPALSPAAQSVTVNNQSDLDASGWYTIDLAFFGIDKNGANARKTTDGINRALLWAKNRGFNKVTFPTGTYLIQCNWNNRFIAPTDGILVPSDMTVNLGASTFIMEANGYPAYSILSIVGQSNVTILGGTLIGDLGKHVYTPVSHSDTHEWGFGICVSASRNVLISGVTIRNTTGDGIILEGSYESLANGGQICSNVKILNCDISNCRRQGISVIGASGSEIAKNKIYNIKGTDPQYGIDVEPEFDYVVTGLKIHDNTIYGCSGGAITCNKGSNYEVYNNIVSGNILAVHSSSVKIYQNTIKNDFIRVMKFATNVTVYDNKLQGKSWVYFG